MGGVLEPELPTPYDWAGGLVALRRMIDCFYDRVEADEALTDFFTGGVSKHHRAHVADWWAEVLGGPEAYTEQNGGYGSMLRHHLGLAMENSAPGAAPVKHAPVPRWGWGVTPPYRG